MGSPCALTLHRQGLAYRGQTIHSGSGNQWRHMGAGGPRNRHRIPGGVGLTAKLHAHLEQQQPRHLYRGYKSDDGVTSHPVGKSLPGSGNLSLSESPHGNGPG